MTTPTKRWARRNPILVVFLTLMFWAAFVGYVEDIQSCRRTVETRKAQQHNIGVLRAVLGQDATRARAYARVDHNPRGARINETYSRQRLAWTARLHAPDVPSCFPIPGV